MCYLEFCGAYLKNHFSVFCKKFSGEILENFFIFRVLKRRVSYESIEEVY